MTEEQHTTVTVREYGFSATISLGLLHRSLDYVCPNPDTCSWCNRPPYVPPVLTPKQKIKRELNYRKRMLGKLIYKLSNKLGYYDDVY